MEALSVEYISKTPQRTTNTIMLYIKVSKGIETGFVLGLL